MYSTNTSEKLKLACLGTNRKRRQDGPARYCETHNGLNTITAQKTVETYKQCQITFVKTLKSVGIRGTFGTVHLTF